MYAAHSLEIIPIHLPRHHHHPQQEDRPHDQKRKRRLPVHTQPVRLQPRQRRLARPRGWPVGIAVAVHGPLGAVELDRGLDEAGQPQHEEDEGAEHDDAGEELPLVDEAEEAEEEEQRERADGDHVGEDPGEGGGVSRVREVGNVAIQDMSSVREG